MRHTQLFTWALFPLQYQMTKKKYYEKIKNAWKQARERDRKHKFLMHIDASDIIL